MRRYALYRVPILVFVSFSNMPLHQSGVNTNIVVGVLFDNVIMLYMYMWSPFLLVMTSVRQWRWWCCLYNQTKFPQLSLLCPCPFNRRDELHEQGPRLCPHLQGGTRQRRGVVRVPSWVWAGQEPETLHMYVSHLNTLLPCIDIHTL